MAAVRRIAEAIRGLDLPVTRVEEDEAPLAD
jgi:hypothetical protein